MTDHIQHQCGKEWCTVCRNRLQHCTVCGARDQEQPTDCPGRPMTQEELGLVYAGDLDFKDDDWVDGLV